MPSSIYVKPHPVKLMRKGGTVFMRLSPAVLDALGLSHFDFVVVTVRGDQIRARKVVFEPSILEKSKKRPVRRVKR